LAAKLLRSLDDVLDPEAEKLWLDEVMRRNADFESGNAGERPVEEVISELKNKFS
jgi:hypothetical protein